MLLGPARNPFEERLQRRRLEIAGVALEAEPELADHLGQGLDLGRIGLVVDPVQTRLVGVEQQPGDRHVGRHHELFDEAVGAVARTGFDGHHPTLGIEQDLRFGHVEIEAASPVPGPTETGRRLGEELERVGEARGGLGPLGPRALQPPEDLFVGAPAAGVDHRLVGLDGAQVTLAVDLEAHA